MIKKDLSALPVAAPQQWVEKATHEPDSNPLIGPVLAQNWFDGRTHDDNLPRALPDAGPIRGSDAGKCSRSIWYRMQGTPKSDPPSIADHWRMDLGTLVHVGLQDAIEVTLPNAVNELKIDLNYAGIPGSQHADIVSPVMVEVEAIEEGEMPVKVEKWEAIEIKTVNGYGYKTMATRFRGGPGGPRESHVMQMALSVAALHHAGEYDMVGGRIVYLSMENVGPEMAEHIGLGGEVGRFCAEWFFPLEQCLNIAGAEAERFEQLIEAVDQKHEWVEGLVPTSAYRKEQLVIMNPKTGAGIDLKGVGDKTWQCNYCDYQSQCIRDYDQVRPSAIVSMDERRAAAAQAEISEKNTNNFPDEATKELHQ